MPTDILLFGAVAVRPAVVPLIAAFEAEAGRRVESRWELNPALKSQVEAGAPCDLVVTNPHFVEDLVAVGKLVSQTQRPFGRIAMGIAAGAGSETLCIETVEMFDEVLRTAKSIAYAGEGSSGIYFRELLQRRGLWSEAGPKLVPVAGAGTATSVARGEAQLAVVPVTSILAAGPGVVLVGRFPAELGGHIDFDLAVSTTASNRDDTLRLAEFLMSADCDEPLRMAGVDRRSMR